MGIYGLFFNFHRQYLVRLRLIGSDNYFHLRVGLAGLFSVAFAFYFLHHCDGQIMFPKQLPLIPDPAITVTFAPIKKK